VTKLGIPTVEEYFRMYCLNMGIPPIDNWNFYMAFSFFRVAAILQGVYKRSLTGKPWPDSHRGSQEIGLARMVEGSIFSSS
jgi:aminoglycoside phosphotransferase (APT) family kinase protein